MTQKTILFLCTGNYYRSRFAEVLFNSVARKFGLAWNASSRALALERGVNNIGPMAQSAIQALATSGIRDAESCSRFPVQVTPDELDRADLVIALKQAEHLPLLQERYAAHVEKVQFWHVDDAPGALPVIEKEITNLVSELLGGGKIRLVSLQDEPKRPAAPQPRQAPLKAKVGRETAGRRGKGVTTVFDLDLNEAELQELAAQLKQRCGSGGTVKAGRIEIQGDQRERVISVLEAMGFKVKRAGG